MSNCVRVYLLLFYDVIGVSHPRRDAIVIAAGDTLTSIFGGFVIFSYIGYMSTTLAVPVEEVATQGQCM